MSSLKRTRHQKSKKATAVPGKNQRMPSRSQVRSLLQLLDRCCGNLAKVGGLIGSESDTVVAYTKIKDFQVIIYESLWANLTDLKWKFVPRTEAYFRAVRCHL
jgi:hypothetical protein